MKSSAAYADTVQSRAVIDDYPTRDLSIRRRSPRSRVYYLALTRSCELVAVINRQRQAALPSTIPIDVEYARYLGKRRYSRESPSNVSSSLLAVLPRAHLLRSSGRARRLVGEGEACCCSARGAARCSRDFEACSSFPRLVRACARVSPSFSRRLSLSLSLSLRPNCSILLLFTLAYLRDPTEN